MSALPAYCPKCKSIFPARNFIDIGPGSWGKLENILVPCTVCGYADAKISDGIYSATNDAIHILLDPSTSQDMLAALKALAERAQAGKISNEEAEKEAEKISPKYAGLIRKLNPLGPTGWTLLLTIIQTVLAGHQALSPNDTKKIVDAITQQTITLKDVVNQQRMEREREGPSSQKAVSKPLAVKDPLKRRKHVNKKRRETMKQRRLEFGGSRTH